MCDEAHKNDLLWHIVEFETVLTSCYFYPKHMNYKPVSDRGCHFSGFNLSVLLLSVQKHAEALISVFFYMALWNVLFDIVAIQNI